jgi:hypothetical protein
MLRFARHDKANHRIDVFRIQLAVSIDEKEQFRKNFLDEFDVVIRAA